jgi:hypothetical protein
MNADCAAACLHRRVSVFIGGHCFGVKAKTTAKQRGHEFHESTRSQSNGHGCNRRSLRMNADCAAACLHRRVSVFIGGQCFGVKAKTTAKHCGHEFHESTRSQCNGNGCNRQGRQGHAM